MAGRKNPFSRIRLVYRSSSILTKCVVLAAIVLSTAALLTLSVAIQNAKTAEEAKRAEAAALEQQNAELEENIAGLGSVQSDKELAEKYLGLVDPDTVIFVPEQ